MCVSACACICCLFSRRVYGIPAMRQVLEHQLNLLAASLAHFVCAFFVQPPHSDSAMIQSGEAQQTAKRKADHSRPLIRQHSDRKRERTIKSRQKQTQKHACVCVYVCFCQLAFFDAAQNTRLINLFHSFISFCLCVRVMDVSFHCAIYTRLV